MFKSAIFKLTSFYCALLFAVCLMFTIPAYSVSSQRITQGAENQSRLYRDLVGPGNFDRDRPDPFDKDSAAFDQIQHQVDEDQKELLRSLIIANLGVLLIGTILCYLFAKQTLKPIEELHKAQARFTADASHELRTPLTVMKTEIEVALKKKSNATELKEILISNLEEVERLQALSDQLLMLTKTESNSNPQEKIDLSNIVIKEINDLNKSNHEVIHADIQEDIFINGNAQLCGELIRILINNAISYSKDVPDIKVELKKDGTNPVLVVLDHGVGINEKDLPFIFDRFYRGGSNKHTSGHGLGLSIAKDIADRHEATIVVESIENEYTKFSVTFNS